MPVKQFQRIVLTITVWLTVTMAGALLTWYQVSETDLSRAASVAREVVSSTERLLDETRSAIDRASPLLSEPCTQEVSAGLRRLSIGMEHIREINLFQQNLLACSSFGGAVHVREFLPAGDGRMLFLAIDESVGSGVPVIILRRYYGDWSITASIATRWIADALKQPGDHRPLSLRIADIVLTDGNHLAKEPLTSYTHAVHSGLYPFSVEYSGDRRIPLTLFWRDGALSLLLSVLLGAAVAAVLWHTLLRRSTELSRAVHNGEIVPWYQPIVDAGTSRIVGVEILARWKKPDGTVLSPASFIAEAESSDLIIPLTQHLTRIVASELPSLLNDQSCWHVGLNVTQAHLQEPGFFTECLAFTAAFPPGSINLTLELTEREPFGDSEAIRNRLEQLHGSGMAVALDDFGTGYSNMEYLSRLPVDIIKLDRVFVSRIGQGAAAEQLLVSLIDLASVLNLKIVAEGVETEVQANWLRERGVHWQQGFYYSPPVPLHMLRQQLS
ncbi:cyclic diguanylate phosphodiesterase [Klebsiella quasipneumoniae]|uniref:EAL domain-containing protein n=1 Tax=Klebsiella quasipneumoniae TaxID=1463165 RepID=UPI0011DDD56B|nr:EAL domain-containing protein [Klebsiella quasipneumoniae]TXV34461.1 cyclic diguanylate phosphodiesterase [Klebsiella quasipneumoniae]TXV68868.1 cyclic diguanylate phosphodiesterase [Klebsiella quasipneumoniae]TXW57670.1 cyclic diguanylate phosphodiesterase [Klebsiella quasipneumoniae]TXW73318.1 cyclic diguanylate phosphodiesterase [Klebsiella quasipneumoniae]